MRDKTITQLEIEDAVARAQRAREALISAVERLPEDDFLSETPPEWSAGRILRHVAWVEHYWTLSLEYVAQATPALVEIGDETNPDIAIEASRRAGTPQEPVAAIPPYATRRDALSSLRASHAQFLFAIQLLGSTHFAKRVSRRGVVPLRFLIEHVIQHDWDHAVQITGLRSH